MRRSTNDASQASFAWSSSVRHNAPSFTSVVPFAGADHDVSQGRLAPSLKEAFRSRLCLPSAAGAITRLGALASARAAFLQPPSAALDSARADSSHAARVSRL